jgi:prepilin-type N-terminal cleavage/methylation domain-containing protein
VKKKTKRLFTLLEVMIAISILAIGAGALSYRVSSLIAQKQFETDSGRLKSLLLSSRMLALNTHSDWKLTFKKMKRGWSLQLICREDPDLIYPVEPLCQKELTFNNKPLDSFTLDFFSTGQVRPLGEISLKKGAAKDAYQVKLKIPDLFQIEENGKIAPFRPGNPIK